jgi:hypothetical protein
MRQTGSQGRVGRGWVVLRIGLGLGQCRHSRVLMIESTLRQCLVSPNKAAVDAGARGQLRGLYQRRPGNLAKSVSLE